MADINTFDEATGAIDLRLTDEEIAAVHNRLAQLESERDHALSEACKMRLALSLALEIAEDSEKPSDIQACAYIRQMIGEPPKRGNRLRLVT